jgi:hypothetical protein
VIQDAEVELKQIMRELDRIHDDDLEELIIDWVKELDEVYSKLYGVEDDLWDVAKEMEKEGL